MGRTKERYVFKYDRLLLTAIKTATPVGVHFINETNPQTLKIIGDQGYELSAEYGDDLIIIFKHSVVKIDFGKIRTHDVVAGVLGRNEYDAEPVLDAVIEKMGSVAVTLIGGEQINANLAAKDKYFITLVDADECVVSVNKAQISRINVGPKKEVF